MSNNNPIPVNEIEALKCFDKVDSVKKMGILKLSNRKYLSQCVNVSKLRGYDIFLKTFSPDAHTKSIVYELLDMTECIGCAEKFPYEIMLLDDAEEKYCQPCWDDLSPIFQEEYRKFKEEENIESDGYIPL